MSLDHCLKELMLTPREREIAYLVYEGLRNNEIADRLCISVYTVENHLKSIFAKLRVNSRTRLIHKLMSNDVTAVCD